MSDSKIFLDKRSKTTYIRRRKWNKDLGKMDQETLHKYESWDVPPTELPDSANLTENELEQYNELVSKETKEKESRKDRVTLSLLKSYLNDAIKATESIENLEKMNHDQLEELAEMTNILKKQINKHKNTLKKRKAK
ncbi:hypothetical protein NB574_00005 [Vibrio vulnificus]|nr:hypothetical protein [Vibrio vulnificus]MCR9701173.1 hypothetical protein [Vibrio vulnificus]